MIGFMVKTAARVLFWAVALYVFFFVPLGERTLYEHLAAIAATPEARELGGEVGELVGSATEAAADAVSSETGERVLQPAKQMIGRARERRDQWLDPAGDLLDRAGPIDAVDGISRGGEP